MPHASSLRQGEGPAGPVPAPPPGVPDPSGAAPDADPALAAALADAYERSADTFGLYDRSHRLLFLNRVARERARLAGGDPAGLLGRPLREVWPQLAGALAIPEHQRAAAERTPLRLELTSPFRRDAWVEAHVAFVGGLVALVVRDATDERRARIRVERLQGLTARLSEALTPAQVADVTLHAGMDVLGAVGGGVVLRVGEDEAALVADAGFDAAHTREWVRFPLSAPYPVNDAIRERATVLMAGIDEWRARYPVLAPTIAANGYEGYAATPLEVDGRVLGAINYNFRERRAFGDEDRAFLVGIARLAAQALERARLYDALRAGEERFRLASEAMAGGLYDWDVATGRVQRTDDFGAVVGYSPDEQTPDSAWWRDLIHPDDVDAAWRAVGDALASDATGYAVEYRVRHRDGRWLWVLDRGRIVRDAAGRGVRVVGGTTDVTVRRAAAEERERLLVAAEQASRAKSDFLAKMSHELRTPLNAIAGYADLVALGVHGPVTDAQREALGRVQRNQQHLLGLINDILDFSKVEAGALRLTLATLDLREVVATLETLIGPEFERRGIAYRALPCARPLLVRGDRERVVQVCLNLVTNALKATAPGGEVRISCEARAGAARVDVADTGVGIPADQLEAIFSPFTQLGRALNKPGGGVGLGLAISRELARAMGGDLTVVSEVGVGSTFTLSLAPA